LLTMLPKFLGDAFVRFARRGERRYETHFTLWGLRRLARRFEIVDYTKKVVRDPVRFEASDMVREGSLKQRAAVATLTAAYWAFPTYLWILRKPDGRP